MRVVAIPILISLMGCSKVNFWTTTPTEFEDSAPYITEIQITDSTYSEYVQGWSGCFYSYTATCFMSNSSYVDDTILVFDWQGRPSPNDSDTYVMTKVIKMAFLERGRKLYPIYNHYPRLHPYYPHEYDPNDIDSSTVKSFTVNWKGWSRNNDNSAYINFAGEFYTKGKYQWLRNEVNKRRNTSDSIEWTIYYPREFVNDSMYYSTSKTDYSGLLKNNGQ